MHANDATTESDVASTCSGSGYDTQRDTEPVMGLDEKLQYLLSRETCDSEANVPDPNIEPPDDVDDAPDLDPGVSELSEYREILVNTAAYRWLKASLQTENALYVPGPEPITEGRPKERPCAQPGRSESPISQNPILSTSGRCRIGDEIIQAHTTTVATRFSRTRTQRLKMHFAVDWDPSLFAREQQYDAPLRAVLAQTITLTGHGNNLQAATCEKYLEQTWPHSGTAILELIQRAVGSKEGGSEMQTTLSDKTELIVALVDGQLILDAAGNVFSVAEVAEQVAWIGAALRSSPSDDEAAHVSARVLDLSLSGTSASGNVDTTTASCRIEFDTELLHDSEIASAGKCWRGMFGNPVVVRGFPIPRRADADTGLEVPLDMVAGLTNCRRVVNFAGVTFIKGFAAMLTAVKVVGNMVYWHLCYNADGGYMSYGDFDVSSCSEPHTLSLDSISRSRHIVGWSDNVRNYAGMMTDPNFSPISLPPPADFRIAGAPDAEYAIEETDLPKPSSGCVLEKVTVSGSAIPFITPGASFLVGVKDKPLHLGFGSGDDYMGNLITVGKRHVVFYDTEEKRAWLVDGASAVLHLLRAYLKFYAEDDVLGRYFTYSHGDIEEARPCVAYTGAKAAYEILTNEKNQSLPLYPKKSAMSEEKTTRLGSKLDEDTITVKVTNSHFTLGERVEQICHILLQIAAYHDNTWNQTGYGFRIKSSPRHHIEGFEYVLTISLKLDRNLTYSSVSWTLPPVTTRSGPRSQQSKR